jgi:hypothetical protein
MRNNDRLALVLLITFGISLIPLSEPKAIWAQQRSDKKPYICPPCGCNNDNDVFDKPGACPSGNMALVEKEARPASQPVAPLARSGQALVYDARRRAVLLLNGDHGLQATQGEVWSRDGDSWKLIDRSGPPPRTLAGVAYDTKRRVLVLQGGLGARDTLYGDTQEWDGEAWRQVKTDGPGIRNHHAMAYDAARVMVVLFGGQDRNITLHSDTWEWGGKTWKRVATAGPPARALHALAYDKTRQRRSCSEVIKEAETSVIPGS